MTISLLVADDDPALQDLIRTSFSRHGFLVDIVGDGADAVERFQRGRYDVVLLDAKMPRTSGFEAAMAIRTAPRGNMTGIAMMSAAEYSDKDRTQLLKHTEVDAFFQKPFMMRDVRERLAEIAFRYTGATAEPDPPRPEPPKTPLIPRTRGVVTKSAPAGEAKKRPAASTGVAVIEAPAKAPAEPAPAPVKRTAHPFDRGERVRIEDARAVPRALLEVARSRRTGVLELKHRDAEARLSFLRGVLVGAHDNLPENRLGERLIRSGAVSQADLQRVLTRMEEKGERLAEAILGLGLCDEDVLLTALVDQGRERAICAMGWTEGEMRFRADLSLVDKSAGDALDPFDVILSWFTRMPDGAEVRAFFRDHMLDSFETTHHLEPGLVAYARIAPQSQLPALLMNAPMPLYSLLDRVGGDDPIQEIGAHVYAMWMAELIWFQSEPAIDEHPVPRRFNPDEMARDILDRDAVRKVQREWLRVRGRSYYDVLGVDAGASAAEIRTSLEGWKSVFGPDALHPERLGPAAAAARELFALLEDMELTLLDERQREAYDATRLALAELGASHSKIESETLALEGKLALERGELTAALASFEQALSIDSEDLDVVSYRAWIQVLMASETLAHALSQLRAAAHAKPSSARPALFLGLAAQLHGDVERARKYLRKAWRRCPDDPEVRAALKALPPESAEVQIE